MAHSICIFGEVLFDCFPDGREILGGAPFNVAWHLQGFGQSPLFISRLGKDAPANQVRCAMAAWGMTDAGLQSDQQHPTGRVTVSLVDGEPSYDIVNHSAYDFIDGTALPALDASLIYHGSLALRNPPSHAALERLKSDTQGRIFIDVNLRDPWWQRQDVLTLVKDASWAKLNADELGELGANTSDPVAAAEAFRKAHGLEGVVLTLGADGAIGLSADQPPVRVRPSASVEVVDAVGAGDAFSSVLLLGLSLGWPLAETMERAQTFAAELVQRRGATQQEPALYQSYRDQWGV